MTDADLRALGAKGRMVFDDIYICTILSVFVVMAGWLFYTIAEGCIVLAAVLSLDAAYLMVFAYDRLTCREDETYD